MASIYPNRKNGKLVSFKFKAFLGRDENGKQIFKCKTWTPQAIMTEKREGVNAGMVLDVLQKGYLLKDKVIRPAMVRVSE